MSKQAVWDLEITLAVEKCFFYCFLGQHCPEQISLTGMSYLYIIMSANI